jgi:hypothetical protein
LPARLITIDAAAHEGAGFLKQLANPYRKHSATDNGESAAAAYPMSDVSLD